MIADWPTRLRVALITSRSPPSNFSSIGRPVYLKPAGLTSAYSQLACTVIKSFRHRGLKRLYEKGDRSGVRPDLVQKVQRILTLLDSAESPQGLDLPGYHLHPLKGDMKGYWAVTVRANWRVTFRFSEGNAHDVDLIDYH